MNRVEQGEIVDEYITRFHLKSEYLLTGVKSIDANLTRYYNDLENDTVIVESIQQPVAITRRGVYFTGRVDQVRLINGQAQVWEIKYSDMLPQELVSLYLPQLLFYADALQCYVGGIINVKNYNRDLPVFHHIYVSDPIHTYTNYIAERLFSEL